MKRYSIIQSEKECYVCHTRIGLHIHETWFGKNRQNSIEDGLVVYLCGKHHNLSKEGVHFNHELDYKLKIMAEQKWIEYYHKTKEDFLKKYKRNLL